MAKFAEIRQRVKFISDVNAAMTGDKNRSVQGMLGYIRGVEKFGFARMGGMD